MPTTERRLIALCTALLWVVLVLVLERVGVVSLPFDSAAPSVPMVDADGSHGIIGGTSAPAQREPVESLGLIEVTTEIPDSVAGARMRWALERINVYSSPPTDDEIAANFSAQVLANLPPHDLAAEIQRISASNAPMALVGLLEAPSEHRIVGVVSVPGNRYRAMVVAVEDTPPHALTELVIRAL